MCHLWGTVGFRPSASSVPGDTVAKGGAPGSGARLCVPGLGARLPAGDSLLGPERNPVTPVAPPPGPLPREAPSFLPEFKDYLHCAACLSPFGTSGRVSLARAFAIRNLVAGHEAPT